MSTLVYHVDVTVNTWRCTQHQYQIVFHVISTSLLFARTCSGVNKLWLLLGWVYGVTAIILDIANYRLFRLVRSHVPAEKPKHFMKIKFLNKAVDAINLLALLQSASVTDKIPVYFRDKESPTVSYEYTSTVASKLFNFAPTLSNLNVS